MSDLPIFRTAPADYSEIARLFFVDGYDYKQIGRILIGQTSEKSIGKVARVESALNRICTEAKEVLDGYRSYYESRIPEYNKKSVGAIKSKLDPLLEGKLFAGVNSLHNLDAGLLASPAGANARKLLSRVYARSVPAMLIDKLQRGHVQVFEVNILTKYFLSKIKSFPDLCREASKGKPTVAHSLLSLLAGAFIGELVGERLSFDVSHTIGGRARRSDGYAVSANILIECGRTSATKIKQVLDRNGVPALLLVPFQGEVRIEHDKYKEASDSGAFIRNLEPENLPDSLTTFLVLNTYEEVAQCVQPVQFTAARCS